MRRLLGLFLGLPLAVPGQAPPTIRTTTTEVQLDVVVRDKQARIIRDLRPEEIRVFEDGVPQKVRHFQFFGGRAPADAASARTPPAARAPGDSTAAAPAVKELREISVVTVVVWNLDPAGRKIARDTMRAFLKDELRPKTYVGVIGLRPPGYRPEGLPSYDSDPERISAAVERAVMQVSGATGLSQDRAENGGPASAPPPSPPMTARGQPANPLSSSLVRMMSMHWLNDFFDSYDASVRQVMAIRQLVRAQAALPGRKVLLLFAAGLPMHPDTVEALLSSISAANRSNVTIYAVDTRGQRVSDTDIQVSDLASGRALLKAAAEASMQQQYSRSQIVTPEQIVALDTAERSIHSDMRGNLADLAEGTGGKLLAAGDLREPLRRAMEDVRTHYELTYTPVNQEYDAHFRRIEVKVARPGAAVFARSGYYALPVLEGREVNPFEMATLKALNTSPLPREFRFRADVLRFRPGPERSQGAFVFQVPVRELSIAQGKESVAVHVSVTALVRDAAGQIVEKLARDIPYRMPVEKVAGFRRAAVNFSTPIFLAPGRYTIETAAVDRNSGKAAVLRSVLVLPAPSPDVTLAISDVSLVRRVDAIDGAPDERNPFEAHGGRVLPDLSGAVSSGAGGEIALYAVAYPPSAGPVRVAVELMRDGQTILRSAPMEAPAAPCGIVPVLVKVPAAKLAPGQYEAMLTFRWRDAAVQRETPIVIQADAEQ